MNATSNAIPSAKVKENVTQNSGATTTQNALTALGQTAELPKFFYKDGGFYVDELLSEFRSLSYGETPIEFIPFNSRKGRPMLERWTEEKQAREKLQKLLPPGSTVYTLLRHCSSSGMLRVIDFEVIRDGEVTGIPNLDALGFTETFPRDSKRDGFRAGGCGMDMGFHLVYSLSSMIYRGGFDCIGDKCPSNDHHNRETQENKHHSDGGYAIKQRWL